MLPDPRPICRPGSKVVDIAWSPDGHDVCIAYSDGFLIRGGFAGAPICACLPSCAWNMIMICIRIVLMNLNPTLYRDFDRTKRGAV